jgi:hypothetical protein
MTFEELRVQLRDATDAVAARQQEFLDKLNESGITAAEEEAAKAGLQTEIDRLKTYGQSSSEPIPDVPKV